MARIDPFEDDFDEWINNYIARAEAPSPPRTPPRGERPTPPAVFVSDDPYTVLVQLEFQINGYCRPGTADRLAYAFPHITECLQNIVPTYSRSTTLWSLTTPPSPGWVRYHDIIVSPPRSERVVLRIFKATSPSSTNELWVQFRDFSRVLI